MISEYQLLTFTLNLKQEHVKSNAFFLQLYSINLKLTVGILATISKKLSYIAFAFTDGKYYFIRYTKSKFKNIKTSINKEWNQTNFGIPLNKCISKEKFIHQINKLKLNLLHVK